MPKLAIVCFDGVTDLDVFLHWDILNRPSTMFPKEGETWEVALLGTNGKHKTQAGIELSMHGHICDARNYDAVVHSSGYTTLRSLMNDSEYLENLSLSTEHQILGSQCSGAVILAASGCLNGLSATTYPNAREALQSFGVEFSAEPFVEHERIATAAGCLAGIQLDEWLLSKFIEPDRVAACINSALPWGSGLEKLS